MMERKEKSALLLETFYRLVAAIFGQTADPEAAIRHIMSDRITGFGTGKHEAFNSREEFIEKIFKVFGKQLPADAKGQFFDVQYTMLDTVGIVHGRYEISYILDGIENKYYSRRSTVFEWRDERWQAIHLHVSEPSAHLAEGESFPLKALKAQNAELRKQVELKTEELSNSLKDLQDTQQQLIQAAKLASLGELTAGIAHEIQNPLNFVNNFSEVNMELAEELRAGLATGSFPFANELVESILDNSEKINQHGKRAAAIVKGMLLHSRNSSGQKEPTDLNALADEYLRLAYHGLRAKDKTFNATMKTDLDPSVGQVTIVPQDIGRVILNLITNAFYAVAEKNKQGIPGYEPAVTVSTRKSNGSVEVKVTDNGNGIPATVLDKIFQPFFTTKPTGKGTGLGLSLSYDIVKAHGGELKVNTREGTYTEFTIYLPAKSYIHP